MGNTNGVLLKLGQGVYYPGQWVQVTANIYLAKDTEVDDIVIKFLGHETTQAQESHYVSTSNGGHTETRTVYEKKKILEHKFKMPPPCQPMIRGQYCLPFQFQLPYGLPPSVHVSGAATLQYKVKVKIHRPGMLKADIGGKLPVWVSAPPPPRPPVPVSAPWDLQKVGKILGMGSGKEVALKVDMDGDLAMPGKAVNFVIEVKNESSREYDSAVFILKQRTDWRCNQHHRDSSDKVSKFKYDVVVGKGASKFQVQVPIPHDVMPTMEGSLMRVRHYFRVELERTGFDFEYKPDVPVVMLGVQPAVLGVDPSGAPPPLVAIPPTAEDLEKAGESAWRPAYMQALLLDLAGGRIVPL